MSLGLKLPPFSVVDSSIAKSWGPLWGSDLVIDDATDKKTYPSWMVSRSEAIHLISGFWVCSYCDRVAQPDSDSDWCNGSWRQS